MKRVKLITEPAELVPLLRAVDTEVKRKVFQEIVTDWRTIKYIEEKYGKDGVEALLFFEKLKLTEMKWEASGKKPEKVYRTYFVQFNVNIIATIQELTEILFASTMLQEDFEKIEKKIIELVEEGKSAGDIAENLKISPLMLRALVKRSTKLDFRGLRIELIKPI